MKITIALLLAFATLAAGPAASADERPRPRPVRGGTTGPNLPPTPDPNQKAVTSKLLVFTREGQGTSNTNLTGEIKSKLSADASVSREFALQWSRAKAGPQMNANVTIHTLQPPEKWAGAVHATMPAGSLTTVIPFTFPPNYPFGVYELVMIGDDGKSTAATVHYDNAGKVPDVKIGSAGAGAAPPSSTGALQLTFDSYTPKNSVHEPRLMIKIESTAQRHVASVDLVVESDSSGFEDPKSLTSSGPKHYGPIKLYTCTITVPKNIDVSPGHPLKRGCALKQVPDPLWALAYTQTTTARFRWFIAGEEGAVQKPMLTAW
jgi:hypothetical protein